MRRDQILQIGIDTVLKSRQECIADLVDFALFFANFGHRGNCWTVRLGDSCRYVLGYFQCVFIQCL